jgi:hyaluronan synthase
MLESMSTTTEETILTQSKFPSSNKESVNSEANNNLSGFVLPGFNKFPHISLFPLLAYVKGNLSGISKATLVRVSTILLLGIGTFGVYLLQSDFEEIHIERMNSFWGFTLIVITSSLLLYRIIFFLYQLYLYLGYKPIESVSDEQLPSCTVIVPAYNEGKQVWQTLLSLADSNFPEKKLQLIAIDDGSKDDTWYWIKKAKEQLGDRLAIYQQPQNKGKRHALYRGFKLATGEIFVTVDSDSIVKPDTLRNLVSPFVTNENCGAVAGNVHVLNKAKAIIPKMLNVSFIFNFEFMRSAQSKLGSVLCTPGALAAYRKDVVLECLPEWINQTFMGQPSDIGEDRAMTNMILKQGHEVLFQKNAYVLTNVPETYKGLYKMFIRWERSNVRENIEMAQFIFKNFRNGSKTGARLLFLNQWLNILTVYPFIILMMVFVLTHPLMFLSSTLLSILMLSSFPVIFYAKKYNVTGSVWAYSYSILYAFGLFWVTPYSIATVKKGGWLTRDLPTKK